MFIPQQISLPAGLIFNKTFKINKYILLIKGIHVFSRQKSIVMNSGKPGYLQFMSIDNGKLIYNVIYFFN